LEAREGQEVLVEMEERQGLLLQRALLRLRVLVAPVELGVLHMVVDL